MKLVNQYQNSNKIKKYLSTQQERIKYAGDSINKNVIKKGGIPILKNYVQEFYDKTYSDCHLTTITQKTIKEVESRGEAVAISTLFVTKVNKKTGEQKHIPRKWFKCMMTIDLILDWYFLSHTYVLHENITFDKIITLFRNEFLIFVHVEQEQNMSSAKRFMMFFTSKIKKIKSYINQLRSKKETNEYEDAMRLKKQYIEKLNEAQEIEYKYIAKLNNVIESNYKKLTNPSSVDNFRENVNSDISPKNGLLDDSINKKNMTLVNKHYVYSFKRNNNKDKNSESIKISKDKQNLRFEMIKLENNKSALRRISKFFVETGIKHYERYKAFTISKYGKQKDIWHTRIYAGYDLATSDSYKKQIFKHLAFLLRTNRDKFFEFLKRLGIVGLYRYKKLEIFSTKQWYKLIMKGYCKLIYNP